jgi:hypothetical protein
MPIRKSLRADLAEARKAGDKEKVSLIRTLIGAIENAESVDPIEAGNLSEAPRRHLSDSDILRVLRSEGDDLRQAADEYDQRGHEKEGERLRVLAVVVDRYAEAFNKGRM